MKLQPENVRFIALELIKGIDMFGAEDKDAERCKNYVCGVVDMMEKVIEVCLK